MPLIIGEDSLFSPVEKIFTHVTTDAEVKEHTHLCFEFSYILAGSCYEQLNNKEYKIC